MLKQFEQDKMKHFVQSVSMENQFTIIQKKMASKTRKDKSKFNSSTSTIYHLFSDPPTKTIVRPIMNSIC